MAVITDVCHTFVDADSFVDTFLTI